MHDSRLLLAWYDRHARALPWRVGPEARKRGVRPDPYRVWLSEIMLQQTTVVAVKPYFEAFTAAWPTVEDLAAADRDDIMRAWAGLGYYARARRMKACAEAVVADHGGRFPETPDELARLPGIGPYTAAAIAAIAFDRPVAAVDGNVERVIARLLALSEPLPGARATIRDAAAALVPAGRPGDFAQAVMDLGATVCTPKRPACGLCPWSGSCRARAEGAQEAYPVKAERRARPKRYGSAFVAVAADGAILLRRRPDNGLLGGMAEVPGSDWLAAPPPVRRPLRAAWRRVTPPVEHVFTHFSLELDVWHGRVHGRPTPPPGCWWADADDIAHEALPSVMKKAIEAAVPGATKRRDNG